MKQCSIKLKYLIAGIFFLKIILLVLFSSDYQNRLFIPFVEHFLSNLDNPWQYFYDKQVDKFPYPPLMLYIYSFFYLSYYLSHLSNTFLQNFFFKFPTIVADILIAYVLIKMFPKKVKEVIIFYFASPIIIYASYVHSQLDLMPMALLILSIYLLTVNKLMLSAIMLGLAISTKFHVIAIMPLIIIYALKNYQKRYIYCFIFIPIIVYLLSAFPYLLSEGYLNMVLKNPKQMMIFDTTYRIGDLKIYLPIFAIIIIYARFLLYPKINNDLLYTFSGILFAIFVFLIFPAPGWYVWIVPFLSIFFIEWHTKHSNVLCLYFALSIAYLSYFLFFHTPEYQDLFFLKMPLDMKIHSEKLKDIVYTVLEVALFISVYSLYKFGVRSNAVYNKQGNIVIGIGGDSASGKSTLLSDLKLVLGAKLLELEGDADHKWIRADENWKSVTALNPKANYIHKQAYDLFALKSGKNIYRGNYNHETGNFTNPKKIEPNDFIVLSGLHPFFLPISRKVIDLKIYLDTEERLRRHWKILRDTQQRGYSKEKVIEQIDKRICDAQKYIHPQKEFADLIVCYFSENCSESDMSQIDNLKLKITLGSSFHIESLIEKFQQEEAEVYWNYSDDLKSQQLILNGKPNKEFIKNIAESIIPNIGELTTKDAVWLDGYRGFVQLIIILMLSEKIRYNISVYED